MELPMKVIKLEQSMEGRTVDICLFLEVSDI